MSQGLLEPALRLWAQTYMRILALPLVSCVFLSKCPHLSEPQLPRLNNGDLKGTFVASCWYLFHVFGKLHRVDGPGGFAQSSSIKSATRLPLFQMRLGEVSQRKSRSGGNWADNPNI